MGAITQPISDQPVSKVKDFSDAALQAVTGEMVTDIAERLVKAVELADEVLQPETIELLKMFPEVSQSLLNTLLEVKKLEKNGTLTALFQTADMIASMKSALTGEMVTDLAEKAVKGVELADDLLQKGTIELATGMVNALHEAKEERQGKEPMSLYQIFRSLSDKETREGLSLLVSFVRNLPRNI